MGERKRNARKPCQPLPSANYSLKILVDTKEPPGILYIEVMQINAKEN